MIYARIYSIIDSVTDRSRRLSYKEMIMGIFSKLFGKKKEKIEKTKEEKKFTWFTLHINARLQPMHRGAIYEDPLDKFLHAVGAGEVSGGGTLMLDNEGGGPQSCDVELSIRKGLEDRFISTIKDAPIPKGSELIFVEEEDKSIPLGNLEGLALYLNGTDLPKEVYERNSVDKVIEDLIALMGDSHEFFSFWSGPKETGLYFYGKSFDDMNAAIKGYVSTAPLCEKSRIEQLC